MPGSGQPKPRAALPRFTRAKAIVLDAQQRLCGAHTRAKLSLDERVRPVLDRILDAVRHQLVQDQPQRDGPVWHFVKFVSGR